MRVLVATHNYPRFAGDPAGAFVQRLARGIARRGHDVRVVAPHTPGTPVRERDGDIEIHRFRYAPAGMERVGYRGDLHRRALRTPSLLLLLPPFLAAFRLAIRRASREFAPQVVHAHWWIPAGMCAVRESPLVITCHGSDVHMLASSRGARWLARRVLGRASALTGVSRFLIDRITTYVPAIASRTRVLRMPVDTAHFVRGQAVAREEPARILYAGNLVRGKGVAILIDAMSILRERGIPCSLRILGEGAHEGELRAHAIRKGVADLVQWSPFVPQQKMPGEYGASTIAVLPTLGGEEGLGLTLVEALLAGCAVVGSRGGGIPEVIEHEVTGLLASDGDADDLAAQLERLLRDEALRERLIRNGTERMLDSFGEEAVAEQFESLYRDVVDDHITG